MDYQIINKEHETTEKKSRQYVRIHNNKSFDYILYFSSFFTWH